MKLIAIPDHLICDIYLYTNIFIDMNNIKKFIPDWNEFFYMWVHL
jgi:hypothetical protein